MRSRMLVLACLGAAAGVLVAGGCSGSGKGDTSATGAGENTFGLSEFTIAAPTNTIHAGKVTVTAKNVGGEVHELVIVRASDVASLPTKADGSVDEEKIAAGDTVGEIEEIAAQSSKSKSFELTRGDYVAFCNIVDNMMGSSSTMMHGGSGMGHVHFAEGMHVAFSVS